MFNCFGFGRRKNNEASGSNNPKVTIGDQIDGLKVKEHFKDDSEYNFKQDGKSDFDVGDKMKKVEAGSFHKNKKVNNTLVGQPQAEIASKGTSEPEPALINGSVIIMNQEFKNNKRSRRRGSKRDVVALEKSFTRLGMTPIVLPDLKYDDVVKEVGILSKGVFSADKLFVFVYMSHGGKNEIVAAADQTFELEKTIIEPILKNDTLSGVAKIFITVACRGNNHFEECDSNDVQKDDVQKHEVQNDDVQNNDGRLVSEEGGTDYSKCIISYSTYKDHVSGRTLEGTYYIQHLCKNLNKANGDTKIHSVFANVNSELSENFIQVPVFQSTMGDLSFKDLASTSN